MKLPWDEQILAYFGMWFIYSMVVYFWLNHFLILHFFFFAKYPNIDLSSTVKTLSTEFIMMEVLNDNIPSHWAKKKEDAAEVAIEEVFSVFIEEVFSKMKKQQVFLTMKSCLSIKIKT